MANNLSPKHLCFLELPKILYNSRSWHRVQQYKHPMHPVIEAAFKLQDPKDYAQLCLEWPYVADTDKTRIAYTQDDRAAEADRQTLTTVGKYLTRHFPTLPDHTIRDLVAKYATVSVFSVSDSSADIIDAVQDGPPSCMQWSEEQVDETGAHPYAVYKPAFGWGIAVRKDGRQINARALVMRRAGMNGGAEIKYFVRTYQRPSDTCTRYSAPDDQLHQWLQDQGYERRNSWRGEKIAYIESKNRSYDFVAPYIDGSAQSVTIGENSCDGMASGKYLSICDGGDYECCSQNGGYESQNQCTCDDCNERIDEDDSYSVGYHGDRRVGPCCIDEYRQVIGRRDESYYVPDDEAVECDGDWYDRDYLGEHDIVQLHDGEYAKMDDAVYVESQSEYYLSDDSDVVEDHNNDWQMRENCVELENGDWALSDDAWCCEALGEYYLTDDVDPVIIHGLTFHPDTSAEDIAEAIKDRTGQENLFTSAAERAEVMAPIVVEPEVKRVRVQSHTTMIYSDHSEARAHELVDTGDYTIVDDSTEPRFLMRGQSGTTHLVKESRVQHFKDLQWVLVDTVAEFLIPVPVVTAHTHANSVYESV